MKKLLKYTACLAILLMIIVLFTGCKVTGGGYFMDGENKCTLGFNAQGTETDEGWEYKGQFQFQDHETGVKFHVSEMVLLTVVGNVADFAGVTKDGDIVNVTVWDNGKPGAADDGDEILIISTLGTWAGVLEGGNIQIHK